MALSLEIEILAVEPDVLAKRSSVTPGITSFTELPERAKVVPSTVKLALAALCWVEKDKTELGSEEGVKALSAPVCPVNLMKKLLH